MLQLLALTFHLVSMLDRRCEGDCDNDDQCGEGLICLQMNGLAPFPGCNGTQSSSTDYCVDVNDYDSFVFLPTGGFNNGWRTTAPIEVDLAGESNMFALEKSSMHGAVADTFLLTSHSLPESFIAGENTIKVALQTDQTDGPSLDYLRVEGIPITSSSSSFRNPPHFMSKLIVIPSCKSLCFA